MALTPPSKPTANPVRKAVAKQLVPPPTTLKPGIQPVAKRPGVLLPVVPKPVINIPSSSGKWSMFKGGPLSRQTTGLKRSVRAKKSPTGRNNQWL